MHFSFKEWLVQTEARARFASPIGYEEIPDTIPRRDDIVIAMDTPRAAITNKNTYGVLNVDMEEGLIKLLPIENLTGGTFKTEGLWPVPRKQWNDFTLVNEYLTRPERVKWHPKGIWMMGEGKEKWIENRRKRQEREKKKRTLVTPIHEPISQSRLSNVRSYLSGPKEEPAVTAASVFGREPGPSGSSERGEEEKRIQDLRQKWALEKVRGL